MSTPHSNLSERARRFAAEYMKDRNGKAAAMRAGYSPNCAASSACRLLKQSEVWELIDGARRGRSTARGRSSSSLTTRELRVLDEYFTNGFKKKEALIAAGYAQSTAAKASARFFQRVHVIAEIERRDKANATKYEGLEDEIVDILTQVLRAGRILAKFKKVADDGSLYWDFRDAKPEDLAVISELATETYVEGKGPEAREVKRFKVKHADVTTAATLLMRHKGMLKDNLKVEGELSIIDILQQRGRQASPEKQSELTAGVL